MTRRVVSVDPGLGGAIAVLHGDQLRTVHDMPTLVASTVRKRNKKGEMQDYDRRAVDPVELLSMFRLSDYCPEFGYPSFVIEQQQSRRGENPHGAFRNGEGYGLVRGVGVGVFGHAIEVRPQDWKADLGLVREEGETDLAFKRRSLELARQTWPEHADTTFKLVKHVDRAEAALLGLWQVEYGK